MHFDRSSLFHIEWSLKFGLALLNIMFINLILSGDNAVLIGHGGENSSDTAENERHHLRYGRGRVADEMIMTDHIIEQWLHPSKTMEYAVQAFCTVGVVIVWRNSG